MAKLHGMAKRDARSTAIAATIFLFPAVALLIVYMVYPIIDTFMISRLKWNGFYTAEKINVGWENWITLINDQLFWNAFLHNVILMVCSILIQIPLGMALATFLDAGGRKFNLFKILWFLPYLMSSVAVGFLFYYLLATNGGLISGIATLFAGKRTMVDLLGKSPHALYAVIGVVAGATAALRRNTVLDRFIMVMSTAFVSMPSFIMGSFLLIIFSVALGWLPANGASQGGLILPVITLALYPMAYITRLTRSSMLDVLGQDYIRTARAKGVPAKKIIFGHALKNSLIPVITYFGPMLAFIVTGSMVVEQIFAVPGIGRQFVSSITNRDYTMIMGTTIFLASLIVIMNLVSDLLYKVVDPRIEFD